MVKKKASLKKKHKTPQKRMSLVKFLLMCAGAGIAAYLIYAVLVFKSSEKEFQNFFVCNPDGTVCDLAEHVHADIEVVACGEMVYFPKETGNTTRVHTHKELNFLHWHAPMRVDPTTRDPLEPKPRTVGAFLREMGYAFPDECPDNPTPSLHLTVNGTEHPDGLDYYWIDGDTIHVEYE